MHNYWANQENQTYIFISQTLMFCVINILALWLVINKGQVPVSTHQSGTASTKTVYQVKFSYLNGRLFHLI